MAGLSFRGRLRCGRRRHRYVYLAARDPQKAAALAQRDPNARVRSPADSLAAPAVGKVEGADTTTANAEAPDPDDSPRTTLF